MRQLSDEEQATPTSPGLAIGGPLPSSGHRPRKPPRAPRGVQSWDSAAQTQPDHASKIWNFMGYANNAWHRVKLQVK